MSVKRLITVSAGRLTQIVTRRRRPITAYDPLGRLTGSNQLTAGQSYNFSYRYNLAGALTSETYPSGRVLTNSYDGANRVTAVTGTFDGQNTNYVASVNYWPHNAPFYYIFGNNLWRAFAYNQQLQLIKAYTPFPPSTASLAGSWMLAERSVRI